ncbi:MAG: hypothetical protein KDA41_22640 [Planctomycetales bacterium]|nr:hypothetical protein [Planctomycetales bacterium]
MTYRVEWIPEAIELLAKVWLDAEPVIKREITEAIEIAERELERDPFNLGESRDRHWRICFIPPLAISFDVAERLRIATVLHVRPYGRRNR